VRFRRPAEQRVWLGPSGYLGRCRYAITDPDAESYAISNGFTCCMRADYDAYTYNSSTNSNGYCNSDSNCHCNGYSCGYCYRNSNSHGNSNSHSNSFSECNSDSYGQACSHSEASSHAAASPVEGKVTGD
jgi:hypothetical protein